MEVSVHAHYVIIFVFSQLAEQARSSIESQLKAAQELSQQLETRLAEAEKEKLELQEEKMKAVESIEEHVGNSHLICCVAGSCSND